MFPQRFVLPERDHGYIPTLSPSQITSVLSINEGSLAAVKPGQFGSIESFESNMLASNFPIEDRRAVARLEQTGGFLFSVFDGHAGAACAQAVSERLSDYIAISLLPHDVLETYSHTMRTRQPMELLNYYPFKNIYWNDELSTLYRNSLQKFVVETLSTSGLEDHDSAAVVDALRTAFVQMDLDISSEAMPSAGSINEDTLEIGLSGSCACVAHIDGSHVHVANSGDTRAVLGQLNEDGTWTAKPLSTDHNCENPEELDRLMSSHPTVESSFILKNNRLLGQLIPLRAFGDVRYKWSVNDLKSLVNLIDTAYAYSIIPMNYHTPPYLTAEPEVVHHKLTKRDKFLVLATDGLWEMMSNEEVVRLVSEHIVGEETEDKFQRTDSKATLGSINQTLVKRKSGLSFKTDDSNAATHLIRQALGPEHRKVSDMLTLPRDVVRYYRDDITITVVFFDSDQV